MSENQSQQAQEGQEGLLPASPNPNPNFPVPSSPAAPQEQQASAAEPQQANPYESIIEQQQAQINALLEQTANLNQQIVNMVNSGAQFASTQQPAQPEEPKPMQQFNPQPLSAGDDWSLESLAKDIGKK